MVDNISAFYDEWNYWHGDPDQYGSVVGICRYWLRPGSLAKLVVSRVGSDLDPVAGARLQFTVALSPDDMFALFCTDGEVLF